MEKKVKYNCLKSLREAGAPVIIVAAVHESEAIANACRDAGIDVSAFCDSEKRKSQDRFCGLEVIHTPTLPERFSKARIIIASQYIPDSVEQLSVLGYNEFYSGQFWGAIDEISKSSFSFINELFDYRRGVNINAKIKLFLQRVILQQHKLLHLCHLRMHNVL